jgi:hypothetical protein
MQSQKRPSGVTPRLVALVEQNGEARLFYDRHFLSCPW